MKISVSKSFNKFVESQNYTLEEKEEILLLFKKPLIRRVFMLSLFLLIWSMIGIFLDSFFVGSGVFATLMMGDFMFMLFVPAITYFLVNIIAKFVFIKLYLKNQISLKASALSTLPYAGSAILFGATLKNEPLFLKALKDYLNYQRKRGFVKVCKMCYKGKEEMEPRVVNG